MSSSKASPQAKAKQLAADFGAVWHSDAGKRVFREIFREAGMLDRIMPPIDPNDVVFYAGKRAVGLHVMSVLRFDAYQLVALALEPADDAGGEDQDTDGYDPHETAIDIAQRELGAED